MRPTGHPPCSTAAVLIILFAACSIEARSTDFECGAGGGCPEGRVCQSGWCVLPGGGDHDGGPIGGDDAGDPVDAAPGVCSEADCDLCDNGTCVIRCAQGNACPLEVVCPAGVPCRVECSGTSSCSGGVDCSAATACEITCSKAMACFGSIECGQGPCNVNCTARDTCFSGVDCSDACACSTDCSGTDSCFSAPECPAAECVSGEGDCTSGADCDFC